MVLRHARDARTQPLPAADCPAGGGLCLHMGLLFLLMLYFGKQRTPVSSARSPVSDPIQPPRPWVLGNPAVGPKLFHLVPIILICSRRTNRCLLF